MRKLTQEKQPVAIEAIRSPDVAARYHTAYEELLRKWPVPWESIHIPTTYGSTHVIASGPVDAAPLILLHGLQTTALVWRANVAGLSRNFRVYAVDVVGQGGKSISSLRLYKRRQVSEWMCELLDKLGIENAAFVGNSYGGFLAMVMALLAPERVKQVVMINPGGVFVSILPFMTRILWDQLLQTLHLRTKKPRPTFSQMLGRGVQLSGDDAEWAAMVSLVAFNGEMQVNGIFPGTFSDAELHAIRQPTLLLMGDNDLVYDPAATLRLAEERMPSLQARMVPGAHHIAAMAKPELVNEMILEFLIKQP